MKKSRKLLACIVSGFVIATGIAILLNLGGVSSSIYSVVALIGFLVSSYVLYRMGSAERVLFYALMTIAVEAMAFPVFVYLGIQKKVVSEMDLVVYLANGLGVEKTSAAILAISVVMGIGIAALAFLTTYFMSRGRR